MDTRNSRTVSDVSRQLAPMIDGVLKTTMKTVIIAIGETYAMFGLWVFCNNCSDSNLSSLSMNNILTYRESSLASSGQLNTTH